jgi:trehalose 6-phosphate synthase/phosphatase
MSSKVSTARQKQRIFFVCYHLPVNISYDQNSNEWSATWAESLLAATEGSQVIQTNESHWVGTVSCPDHPITSEEDKEAVRAVLAKMDCTPLFLDESTVNAHYHGFCKQVLWPAFHNVDLLDLCMSGMLLTGEQTNCALNSKTDWDQSCLESWWEAYKKVNYAFSDMLATYSRPGDIMWVHDYHLSLLPKIVDQRERLEFDGKSVTKKVFLLHIPFPVSHVFRELEFGEEILKGMVHADVVGFHSFDHARHFLNATKRILGLHHESMVGGLLGIKVGKKTVLVSMHNVSIEPVQLDGKKFAFCDRNI